MKKTLSILLLMIFMGLGFASKAQDLQVMYDFGEERQYITTTFEMYKADKWGGTFFFVDFYHFFFWTAIEHGTDAAVSQRKRPHPVLYITVMPNTCTHAKTPVILMLLLLLPNNVVLLQRKLLFRSFPYPMQFLFQVNLHLRLFLLLL